MASANGLSDLPLVPPAADWLSSLGCADNTVAGAA
jgi:hypothetical protein